MPDINVYLPANKVYEITDFARKSGNLRKAHLPYGVHTTGKNWVGLEFFTESGARKFRARMRPRRKGFKISKYFSSIETCSPPKSA
jgi:hypothetical protein